jgi:hypothetical protein
MSGPIVRKYGFPNFDNIFGKKELEHGVDEPEAPEVKKEEEMPKAEKPKKGAKKKP